MYELFNCQQFVVYSFEIKNYWMLKVSLKLLKKRILINEICQRDIVYRIRCHILEMRCFGNATYFIIWRDCLVWYTYVSLIIEYSLLWHVFWNNSKIYLLVIVITFSHLNKNVPSFLGPLSVIILRAFKTWKFSTIYL